MLSTKATYKILVVDDEQVVLDATQRILRADGFPVLTASDAESALALMRTAKPEIVIVDLKLPGISGIEFMEAAREVNPHVVFIVITGYSSVDHAIASLKHGAFDFLPKPFTFDELLSPIHRARRYLQLPENARTLTTDKHLKGYHFLGMHVWAKPDADGTALLGLTKVFQHTMGHVESIALPEVNNQLQQGDRLARLTAEDKWVHVVWSALSGRVLAINRKLAQKAGLINQDPWGDGWLVRISPVNLEQELSHLSQVS
jgi:FixJ family two-component response regulator/glycine cleavage system H lipoate-binding protein